MFQGKNKTKYRVQVRAPAKWLLSLSNMLALLCGGFYFIAIRQFITDSCKSRQIELRPMGTGWQAELHVNK